MKKTTQHQKSSTHTLGVHTSPTAVPRLLLALPTLTKYVHELVLRFTFRSSFSDHSPNHLPERPNIHGYRLPRPTP